MTPADLRRELALIAKADARPRVADTGPLTFRAFLESPRFCGLTLSPAIAAIADASEGRRPTIDDETAQQLFGCSLDDLPTEPRRTVAVRAGGRGGKTSRLLAPKAVHAAWTVPLPDVRRGEVARALLIAPDKDLAAQTLSYARGYIAGSGVLRAALVDAPRSEDDDEIGTKERIALKRPDGRVVEIVIKAATRGGKAARARTLVFAGLDEAAFFYADDGYTVTDREIYRAAIQRVVPGGQVWIVSTPWIAETGILEEQVQKNLGSHETALVAVAGTRLLNPSWDPTGEIEADMRAEDPENAAREIDAVPLAAGTTTFFDPTAIARAFELEPPTGVVAAVGAGGDLGFVNDSSAAAAMVRYRDGVYAPKVVVEIRPEPGEPLKPSVVCRAIARAIVPAGAESIVADGHYRESAREHLSENGVIFLDAPAGAPGKHETYLALRNAMGEGKLCLGGSEWADESTRRRLRLQLRAVLKKPREGGGVQIVSPRKKGSGHGDIVSALVLGHWAVMGYGNDDGFDPTDQGPGDTRWAGYEGRGYG